MKTSEHGYFLVPQQKNMLPIRHPAGSMVVAAMIMTVTVAAMIMATTISLRQGKRGRNEFAVLHFPSHVSFSAA